MITVAVSGGVDSLAALLLLKESGAPVTACHAVLHPSKNLEQRLELLSGICRRLDIPFKILNLQKQFYEHVLKPLINANKNGDTPNPCALCNKNIKFCFLKDFFLSCKDDSFATGHYAHLTTNPYLNDNSLILSPPADRKKNQTYFLALLQKNQLQNLIFPLSDWRKEDVKKFVMEAGFQAPDQEESQDLCFDARKVLKKDWQVNKAGPVYLVDTKKRDCPVYLGNHTGLENYTIGQRKGLGISHSSSLYVVGKNIETNSLLVATRENLLSMKTICHLQSLFVPFSSWPDALFVRLRYKSPLLAVKKAVLENDILSILFAEPVFPGAPGQVAVIYDQGERILGAGIIRNQSGNN